MPLRVAYLVNQYPKVSHSFIRREIRAMEALGVTVDRYAARGWDAELADPADIEEGTRTRHLLRDGVGPLLKAVFTQATKRPGAFFRAFQAAIAMSRGHNRGPHIHLIYLAQACLLRSWLDETPADHLHAHFGTNPAEIAYLVRLLDGPPYSFTLHGQDEIEQAAGLHFARKAAGAAFVVAVSQHGRSQFLRQIDTADWARVHVVHCGLDAEFLDAEAPPLPTAPRLLSIARLSEEKGHLVLLPAIARLRKRHPDLRVTFAGDGPMRPAIEAEIVRLELQDVITITGWVSSGRVREEIAAARLVLQPSFIEGLPVVLMEAMALARPVVATFVGGVPELVTPENGWLVPAGDTDALEAAIEAALSTTEDTLTEMGKAGQAAARAAHDARTEAGKLHDLIEAVR